MIKNSTELEAVIWTFGDSHVHASGITYTNSQEKIYLLMRIKDRSEHKTKMNLWNLSMHHNVVD